MFERVDDLGNHVRMEKVAQRIVCLVPSITETLFAIGAGPRVVGITDFCIHPEKEVQAKTRVGGTKNIVVERVLALEPDLVIANAEENRKHQIEELRAAGVKVFVTFPKTIDQSLRMMEDVAALTDAGAGLAPIVQDIRQARQEVRSSLPPSLPSIFCPVWKDPYMSINGDTFVDSIIREAGGRNIFEDCPDRYPRVTLREVARKKPDIVILPTEPYHFAEDDKADFRPRGENLPAVCEDRIHIVEGELLSWYGPRISRALRVLSAFFRGDTRQVEGAGRYFR